MSELRDKLEKHDYDGCTNKYCGFDHVLPYSTDKLYVFCEVHLKDLKPHVDFEDHLQVAQCPDCVDTYQSRLTADKERIAKLEKRDVEQYIGYIQYAVLCQIRAKTNTAVDDPILNIIDFTISNCILKKLDEIKAALE